MASSSELNELFSDMPPFFRAFEQIFILRDFETSVVLNAGGNAYFESHSTIVLFPIC